MPRSTLFPLPDAMPSERAVLAEPLACAVGALRPEALADRDERRSRGLRSDRTALRARRRPGRDGGHGDRSTRGAPRARAARRCEPGRRDARRARAAARRTSSSTRRASKPPGARRWISFAAAARWSSSASATPRGPSRWRRLVRRGISLRGQFAYSRAEFSAALAILEDPTLDLGWLSMRSLADGALAFALLVEQPERYVKMLLAPNAELVP